MNTYNKMLAKIGGGPHPKQFQFGDGRFMIKLDDRGIALYVSGQRPGLFSSPILVARPDGVVYLDPISREHSPDVVLTLNSLLSDNLRLMLSPNGLRFLLLDGRFYGDVFSFGQQYKERLC